MSLVLKTRGPETKKILYRFYKRNVHIKLNEVKYFPIFQPATIATNDFNSRMITLHSLGDCWRRYEMV